MRKSQRQWLMSSFDRPTFSEPKRIATGPARNWRRMARALSSRFRKSSCRSRRLPAVVPTTNLQSAMASATVAYSFAWASKPAAPTAERASRNAISYGRTTRRWGAPKLLMARAAAPMFSGFRVATRTTRRFSRWVSRDAGRAGLISGVLPRSWGFVQVEAEKARTRLLRLRARRVRASVSYWLIQTIADFFTCSCCFLSSRAMSPSEALAACGKSDAGRSPWAET